MFSPQIQARLVQAWRTALSLLAQTQIAWTQAKPPNAKASFEAAVRWASSDDTEIINAYGTGVLIVIADASFFPVAPVRFDRVVCAHGTFTVQAAHERIVSDDVTFYQMYCTGK